MCHRLHGDSWVPICNAKIQDKPRIQGDKQPRCDVTDWSVDML